MVKDCQAADVPKDQLEDEHIHVCVAVLRALHYLPPVMTGNVQDEEGRCEEVVNRMPESREFLAPCPDHVVDEPQSHDSQHL